MKTGRLGIGLAITLLGAVAGTAPISLSLAAASSQQELAAAVKEVEQAEAALAKTKDMAARAAFYSEDLIDVHPSGWIYPKAESLQIAPNLAKLGGTSKVLKSSMLERKVVPINANTVAIEVFQEIYFEVPNPQEVARAAGTMTFDPRAIAKAAATPDLSNAPGVAKTTNPYRFRETTVWARMDGHWKIVIQHGTRMRDRIAPGRF